MNFLGKEISGCFTIPSGIITTQVPVIDRIAREIPEIGVITTKSIGPEPREGNREPIFLQYAPGCFMNAVGLTNPGADAFARQLERLSLPGDRFLLTSIFGKDIREFVAVAQKLAPFSDGLELNLSCPHATGYGMAIGQDPELVRQITAAVKDAVSIPVIPKLTPNVDDISVIAQAAADGGADALCAINTVGPGCYTVDGHPVLTYEKGGMSGRGILPIGLKCVRAITEKMNIPVIACGGIGNAADVRAYKDAGASIFGVGSMLTGMSTEELKPFFTQLGKDFENGSNIAVERANPQSRMDYGEYVLAENRPLADDLNILVFDRPIDILPGQFVFAWIPRVGEKPFSVLDDDPLTLSVRKAGFFTGKLTALEKGDSVYFRGPYGVPIQPDPGSRAVLVSGGCGLAALYQVAREHGNSVAFFGARDKNHLFYIDELRKHAEVHVATENGDEGHKGFVTDLLEEKLAGMEKDAPLLFFNCGPEPMIEAAVKIESKYAPPDRICNSVDYVTKCGVGVCGSCASPDGRRLCVDGPFLRLQE